MELELSYTRTRRLAGFGTGVARAFASFIYDLAVVVDNAMDVWGESDD